MKSNYKDIQLYTA